ncbi:MAG: CRISPR-associated endoribonuclease Cas6 [Clostridiales bacterium]|nr:CRISPR-associated endoribonuclease Cas6 [Clostridiales bacterium]
MRLVLSFRLKSEEFQLDYRRVILAFLKKAMAEEFDGKLYNRYFKNNHFRDYGFAVLFENPAFADGIIFVRGKGLKVILSADDREKTGLFLYGAALKQRGIRFPLPLDNSMVLERVMPVNSAEIKEERLLCSFLTGGGLVLRDHDKVSNRDTYFTFKDEGFESMFDIVVHNQLKRAGFSAQASESVKFKAVDCKKAVVKHYSNLIDTTLGIFILDGDRSCLQYLYNAGMGSRNGFGFGLFNVISQLREGEENENIN